MLQMMTDLEDEEDWALEDEVEDVDSDVSLFHWNKNIVHINSDNDQL